MSGTGIVYLVGAGPGDPSLLTLRGFDLLLNCDAIVYDALANPAIIAGACEGDRGSRVELHDVGKRGGMTDSARQQSINELLVRLGQEGKRVVRLKGGDPLVFGRGSEEAQALAAAGVPFEFVPGVTAGIAAPAYAGIPVTHRGVATSVTFVTGHEDPQKPQSNTDWSALARAGGTIVLYMGVKTLPGIVAALTGGGLSSETPAAAIQWGTYATQRTVVATLGTLVNAIEREGLSAPVITVIGNVVALRDEIAWFDRRPLFGKRIVVTRAEAQASRLAESLSSRGADVIRMPATRVERVDAAALASIIDRLRGVNWLVFTSSNAVDVFWDALHNAGFDSRALSGVIVAAIGPATAQALHAHGVLVDVVPERFVAESLLEELANYPSLKGAKVMYATAEGARDVLERGMTELGASVDRATLYRSVTEDAAADEFRDRIETGDADLVTFTSASSVKGHVTLLGEFARRTPAACIGPITAEAARQAGFDVVVEAETSTVDGLVDAIVAYYEAALS